MASPRKNSLKFSIRSKMLAMLSAVVILAVALYLYLASRIFYEDKTLLIYELNQTNVQTLGSDVETYLKRIEDKLRTIGILASDASRDLNPILSSIIGEDEGFLRLGILQDPLAPIKILSSWEKPLQLHAKNASYLDEVRRSQPVPFARVVQDGTWVRNVTQPGEDQPAMMTVATPVVFSDGKKIVVYADLLLDSLARIFSREGVAKAYLIDSDGFKMVNSGGQGAVGESMSQDPLLKAAAGSKVRSEVRRYTGDGENYLGSFFKTGVAGTVVESKIDMAEAFTAAHLLLRKSLLYGLIVITAAFLISLIFSHSLTEPILNLVEATRRIAQGDFNLKIPVSSRDELAVLASSFNTMTVDLRISHEQIKEYSRTLEKKVADRTAKLEAQNLAIRETQEALVRTTRLASVGEVAGRAAHDVLNPLTSIMTRLEKIQKQDLQGEGNDAEILKEITRGWQKAFKEGGSTALMSALSVPSTAHPGKSLLEEDLDNLQAIAKDTTAHRGSWAEDVEFLLKECSRISKIVNGMRQLTRVSGSRRPVDVHQLLDEALSSMADLFKKNSIQVSRQFQAPARVLGDHDELLQVMSNLCRNSLQAIQELRRSNPEYPAKFWITTKWDDSSPRKVQIRVCDNGSGVSSGNFDQIFEPTFTTKSIEEGTGLGLSIARRFIRAHDGEITLEKSSPGVETAFLIELPEHQEGSNAT